MMNKQLIRRLGTALLTGTILVSSVAFARNGGLPLELSLGAWIDSVHRYVFAVETAQQLDWLQAIRNLRRGSPICYCSGDAGNVPSAPILSVGVPIVDPDCEDELCRLRIRCFIPVFDEEDNFAEQESCPEFELIYRSDRRADGGAGGFPLGR